MELTVVVRYIPYSLSFVATRSRKSYDTWCLMTMPASSRCCSLYLFNYPRYFLRVIFLDTAVYPMYEILGWYTVGTEATEQDLRIQKQVKNLGLTSRPVALEWIGLDEKKTLARGHGVTCKPSAFSRWSTYTSYHPFLHLPLRR